jgi:hypothetical protein
LIINDRGEILAFQLTPGNVSDVSMIETLSQGIIGKLFGDKGYIFGRIGKIPFSTWFGVIYKHSIEHEAKIDGFRGQDIIEKALSDRNSE